MISFHKNIKTNSSKFTISPPTMFKKLIKKIIWYDKFYWAIKNSIFYSQRKKLNWKVANMLYSNPSKDFFIIWVTGTNWKTTTVNLLHKILNENVSKTMMISTANIKIWNQETFNDKKMTSLDVFQLQQLLAVAKDSGCKIAVLEVSSHSLEQNRFEWVDFDFAVLTNITHEHLDYHGTMEDYAKSKQKLFQNVLSNSKNNKYASFPYDDKFGRKWYEEMNFDQKINYSVITPSMFKAENIIESIESTEFDVSYLWKSHHIISKLPWKFNVYNILAALSVIIQMWLDIEKAISSIQTFEWVDGRMEKIERGWINYFIDFAHTPDALEKTLDYLTQIKKTWKLILLFGAPWNRDKSKRPIMWEVAEKYADIIIATDDDPDTENRMEILNQLTQNIKNKSEWENFFVIPDREDAIKQAVKLAKPWDIVMFAGKWHEKIQFTNKWKRKRNDKEELLKNLNSAAN